MLTDAFLSRLDTLQLAVRGRARGGAGGTRRSAQTGSSAEFSDYREYIPGDDIRRIDWNALARFDKLFLKLFMEEQESAVTILLDASASMAEKWELARQAAETAAYLALTGGDRLRVYCLREDGNRMSPVLSGRPAYARLCQFLDACEPAGEGCLAEAVRRVDGLRKGLCFVISDCYEEEGIGGTLDYLRYCKQECGVIQPLSAFEMDPELDGAVRLEDSESGRKVEILADRAVIRDYRKTLERFLDETRGECFRREVPYMLLDGRKNFGEEIIPLLVENRFV
ncbi:MAG: DUF58 domain-containing protein [Clostridiales bacterium]|nr:DUF58 domain-containing protein [Clostridiales bacterium]